MRKRMEERTWIYRDDLRQITRLVFFAALAAVMAPPAVAGDDCGALVEQLDQLVSDSMAATQTPGISVAVQAGPSGIKAAWKRTPDARDVSPRRQAAPVVAGSESRAFLASETEHAERGPLRVRCSSCDSLDRSSASRRPCWRRC